MAFPGSPMSSSSAAASPIGGVSREGFLLMQEKIETQKGENKILRQKLQSKSEALLILSKELDKVRGECDDYRELTQTLQNKYTSLKSSSSSNNNNLTAGQQQQPFEDASSSATSSASSFNSRSFRDSSVSKHLAEMRVENKRLLGEREKLRRLLKDREEDVKLVRGQLKQDRMRQQQQQLQQQHHEGGGVGRATGNNWSSSSSSGDSDMLVQRLEEVQIKYSSLKQDLQSLLDEKEDLVQERDSYKCKVHRLNHALSALLKNDGFKAIDLDWILAENKFLQDSVEQLQEEKRLANEMGRRYKSALEKAKTSSTASASAAAGVTVSTGKMAEEILELVKQTSFPWPVATMDLQSASCLQELCLSLLETLSDRMLQLKHQRKANKHLMDKLRLMEHKVLGMENGELVLRPSQHLMRGYSSSTVDDECVEEEEEEEQLKESNEMSPSTNADAEEEISNPPDIIVQGIHRNCSVEDKAESLCSSPWIGKDSETRKAAAADVADQRLLDGLEETIVLPDHLQHLVDQAMKCLEEQAQ